MKNRRTSLLWAVGVPMSAALVLSLTGGPGMAQAENLYSVHQGKPFYAGLVDFITSGPIVALCWEGPRVIAIARKLLGKTFGHEAEPGTIRGDFGSSQGFNLVHGSDSPDSARRELAIFFGAGEFCEYALPDDAWIFNPKEDK